MFQKKFITLLFFITLQKIVLSQFWQQITDFPGPSRDDGTSFVIGNNAYCGTGLQDWFVASNDFYLFDMSNETWNAIDSLPFGSVRQYATGFSDNIYGYVFGGVNAGIYYNDLFMYDPTTGNWQTKTTMPATGRAGSACFVINDTAYIIGGRTTSAVSINEVWAYCFTTDTWIQKNNFPFGERWRASAVAQNNKGYLIFGMDATYHRHNELIEYNPTTSMWTQISTFPSLGRLYASMKSSILYFLLITCKAIVRSFRLLIFSFILLFIKNTI